MLNDDDDEIRDMAASSASWVLSRSSASPGADVSLSPLNASGLLAEFIVTNYSQSPILGHRALLYLTGQEPRISGSYEPKRLIPVSELIADYRKESTVLFEEEKQNLFIDDVREADIWSRALARLEPSAYKQSPVHEVSSWVHEGLVYLRSLVAPGTQPDGLLGWVSKPEIFTLGLRVIYIASAFISKGFMGSSLDDTRELLNQLLHFGNLASVHGHWLATISHALQ